MRSLFSDDSLMVLAAQCSDTRWFKAYQHDRDGAWISGSKQYLRRALARGAEVRVLRSEYPDYPYYLTNIQNVSPVDGTDDVCAQALMHITKDGLYNFEVCVSFLK